MKNICKFIFAATLAAGLVSCSKQDSSVAPETNLTPATISVKSDDVKSVLSGRSLTWSSGDEIAVYQYGKYNSTTNRNATKNIFTFSEGTKFSGTIAGYKVKEEGGVDERFYVAYPAANCSACGISTGKYSITVPSTQTGQIADFGASATYLGFLRASTSDPVTSYDGENLTFLKGFNLTCINPILKFNVPAELALTKITISLKDDSDAAVAASGSFQCRIDANGNFTALSPSNSLEIFNEGSVISGDVYAVLAPTSCSAAGVFENAAKTIILDVEKADATASIKLSLSGELKNGIKNLPSLPNTLDWNLPVGPGISQIEMASYSGNAGKILFTTENVGSTIKYGRSLSSLNEITEVTTSYSDGINSIGTPDTGVDAANGVVFTKIAVSTEGYADYCAHTITWPFTKVKGFCYNAQRHPAGSATTGQAISFFGLTFTIGATPGNGTYLFPYTNTAGCNFMWKPSGSNPQNYPQGSISFSAPESGRGCIFLDATVEKNTQRTVTITNGTTQVATFNTGDKNTSAAEGRAFGSDYFNVKAGDVITVDFNASLSLHSLSFLWEPETAE